jgi:hypothetical protein
MDALELQILGSLKCDRARIENAIEQCAEWDCSRRDYLEATLVQIERDIERYEVH